MAKNKSSGWRKKVLLTIMILTAVAALPTTIILFLGMLPSIASRYTDTSKSKTRVLTVGFMNFAACFPFWYQLIQKGHTIPHAVSIISDPMTIVIMYAGAAMGYMIESVVVSIVSSLKISSGRKRLEEIIKIQAFLVEKWGPEVMGEQALDPSGFPIETSKH